MSFTTLEHAECCVFCVVRTGEDGNKKNDVTGCREWEGRRTTFVLFVMPEMLFRMDKKLNWIHFVLANGWASLDGLNGLTFFWYWCWCWKWGKLKVVIVRMIPSWIQIFRSHFAIMRISTKFQFSNLGQVHVLKVNLNGILSTLFYTLQRSTSTKIHSLSHESRKKRKNVRNMTKVRRPGGDIPSICQGVHKYLNFAFTETRTFVFCVSQLVSSEALQSLKKCWQWV